jgi:signal-transduction protein with cAMP-binding, CBS, and nucleotidyltransferase domain
MPFIGSIASTGPTIDHQTNTFDATEELILLGQDHAFVNKEGQTIGIACLDHLLEKHKSSDISRLSIIEFMEPLFAIGEYEHESKAGNLMRENSVKHIAVTNRIGEFVGIVSAMQLKIEDIET